MITNGHTNAQKRKCPQQLIAHKGMKTSNCQAYIEPSQSGNSKVN